MKAYLFTFCLIGMITSTNCQSIFGNWYCDSLEYCLTINRNGYSKLNKLNSMIIKKRGNKLVVIYCFGKTRVFNRYRTWYEIEKLTSDTLILSNKNVPEKEKFEEMGDSTIVFKRQIKQCVNKSSSLGLKITSLHFNPNYLIKSYHKIISNISLLEIESNLIFSIVID